MTQEQEHRLHVLLYGYELAIRKLTDRDFMSEELAKSCLSCIDKARDDIVDYVDSLVS